MKSLKPAELIGEVRFDRFRVDCGARRLFEGDRLLRVDPLPVRLLLVLWANRHDTISRAALMQAVWKREIGPQVLDKAVSLLRTALGDEKESPRYIRTDKGDGYAWIFDERQTRVDDSNADRASDTLPAPSRSGDSTPDVTPAIRKDALSKLRDWLSRSGKYPTLHSLKQLLESGRLGSPLMTVADVVLDDIWDDRVDAGRIDFVLPHDIKTRIAGLPKSLQKAISATRQAKVKDVASNGETINRKLFTTSHTSPVIDKNGRIEFEGGIYDFGWSHSLSKHASDVQAALLSGRDKEFAPLRFDNHITVVTSDRKLLVCLRGRVEMPRHWMVSLGESYDPDIHGSPKIDVDQFVRKTLMDRDELNIHPEVASEASIIALGLGIEWDSMMANVLCYVKLPVSYAEVKSGHRKGEFLEIDGVEFDLDQVLRLVRQGHHFTIEHSDPLPFVPCSIMTLLLASLVEFGNDAVIAALAKSP
jgi:DNA-binding winged helix-turn-helix (wHTH) protein